MRSEARTWLHFLIDAPVSHPIAVSAVAIGIVVALSWFAPRFQIDASPETLLTDGNQDYVRTRVVNRRFDPDEFVLIAYEPLGHPLFSARSFRDLRALTDRLGAIERVEAVRSFLDVPLLSSVTADGGEAIPTGGGIQDLSTATWETHRFSPERMARALADHPIYQNLLVNADGSAAAIQVVFEPDAELVEIEDRITTLQSVRLARELTAPEREALARLEAEARPLRGSLDEVRASEIEQIDAILAQFASDARFHTGGAYVLAHQLIRIIERDLVVFGAVVAVVVALLLALTFGRVRWVAIPAVCCAAGVGSTLGAFALLGLRATVISSSVVALQLILTFAIVVHLIVEYQACARADPRASAASLVRETLGRKALPCLYAAITTSIGFLSLVATDLQPVRAFGYMMILAIAASLAVGLVLFPAVLALLPAHRGPQGPPRRRLAESVLDRCERLVRTRRHAVAVVGVIFAVAGALGMAQLDVENGFIDYFRSSTRVHQELAYIDREFGGTTPLDLVYRFDPPGADLLIDAQTVQQMQRIQQRLEQRPGIGKILSVVDLTAVAKELNGGEPITEYELTAAYRIIDEDLRRHLLRGFISPETRELRMSMRIRDTHPDIDRTELLGGIRNDLEELGVDEDRYTLTNAFVLYEDVLQKLFSSQILTLAIVLVALGVVFVVIFRSLLIGAIALVPNGIAVVGVLGTMGWLGLPLDLMTITVAATALGIAADDTVHFIHRYLERTERLDTEAAVHATFVSVGRAVLCTTGIISIGFSSMLLSDFVPTALFGALTALAMVLALLADLIVLPSLLIRFVPSAVVPVTSAPEGGDRSLARPTRFVGSPGR